MRQVNVKNLNRPGVLPLVAAYCDTFFPRLRGLTFRRTVEPERGLLLVQKKDQRLDSAIHMLGVFTDLSIAWINNDNEVVDVCFAKAWRPFYIPKRPCRYVLEMNPARLDDFQIGDRVSFEEVWID